MTGYVWMRRPDLPDVAPAQVPRVAFRAAHRHQGWVECEEPAEPTQADLDATVRPGPAGPEPGAVGPNNDDTPAKSGGRSAARGKAGPTKVKE